MGIEIERRFLVNNNKWQNYATESHHLRQGYLAANILEWTVRIRISDNNKAWITLKAPKEGIIHHEFEYLIPIEDAEQLWLLSLYKLEKIRYELCIDNEDWVVDCFEGENSSLIIAEVELRSANKEIKRPDWCGQEITGQNQFSNAALAKRPISVFPVKNRLPE